MVIVFVQQFKIALCFIWVILSQERTWPFTRGFLHYYGTQEQTKQKQYPKTNEYFLKLIHFRIIDISCFYWNTW